MVVLFGRESKKVNRQIFRLGGKSKIMSVLGFTD
uniref:Uncharacterized protein n=2 Tax=unclassified Caudoviricetes TaxID=2788787 RepID=A0A8S5QCE6_9CAUD|nr:MAG TPA: hypothetical protein [Siphoviridae sp. ctQWG7]DAE16752.1 MAG TPA: hypothetical protein [Siphoviridae sp. ct8Hy2]